MYANYKGEWYECTLGKCHKEGSLGYGLLEDQRGRVWVNFLEDGTSCWMEKSNVKSVETQLPLNIQLRDRSSGESTSGQSSSSMDGLYREASE